MNDDLDDLNTAVRRAFERQALSAPTPDGLLETVKTRSRRRGIRNGVAGVSAAAVALAGVVVAAEALPLGRSEVAPVAGPGAFGAAEIDLCLAYEDDRLTGLRLAWTRPGESETKVADGPASLAYVARNDEYSIRLDVFQNGQRLHDAEPVTVTGRPGSLGSDPSTGARALDFETGVRDSRLRLTATGTQLDDEQLIGLAEKIDPSECGS